MARWSTSRTLAPPPRFICTIGPEGNLRLPRAGDFLTEVSLPKATGFYRQRTSRGVPFRGLAVLQGHNELAFPSIWMPHGLPPVPPPVNADLAFLRKIKQGLAGIYDKFQCPPPGDLGFNVCLCRDTWDHCAEILSLWQAVSMGHESSAWRLSSPDDCDPGTFSNGSRKLPGKRKHGQNGHENVGRDGRPCRTV